MTQSTACVTLLLKHFSREMTSSLSSVSCIYGLGSAEAYGEMSVRFGVGEEIDRDDFLRN